MMHYPAKLLPTHNRLSLVVALTGLLALLACLPAQAVTVKNLYSTESRVDDQAPATRRAALAPMMLEVLGRVVGEADSEQLLATWPQLRGSAEEAERYVAQFQYRRVSVAEGESELRLRADFSASAIEALVRELRLPQWGVDRPQLLVVLATQVGSQRSIIADTAIDVEQQRLADQVFAVAAGAGLPVALPLMDLRDQRGLPEHMVRTGWSDDIWSVAQRYGASAVLFGQLSLDAAAGDGEVRWSLRQQNQADVSVTASGNVDRLLEAGMWMATRELAKLYAVPAGATEFEVASKPTANPMVDLMVLGASDLVRLKRVEKHLQSRTVVEAANLNALSRQASSGDVVAHFQLQLKAGVDKLRQALAVGSVLAAIEAPQPTAADTGAAALEGSDNASESPSDVPPADGALWFRLQ